MKVELWIDLSDIYITDPKNILAVGMVPSVKLKDYSRYKIEVDLPIHHFRAIEDRKIEAVLIGKEED